MILRNQYTWSSRRGSRFVWKRRGASQSFVDEASLEGLSMPSLEAGLIKLLPRHEPHPNRTVRGEIIAGLHGKIFNCTRSINPDGNAILVAALASNRADQKTGGMLAAIELRSVRGFSTTAQVPLSYC